MIIRAVLFDLDGTLIDSLEDLTDAVNHIRSTFCHPPLTSDIVRLKVGKGARNLVQQVLPGITEADLDRALALFLKFNKQHIADKSRLYPGITQMLHNLAADDIQMAIVSNKNEDLSRLTLETFGIANLFQLICGGDTYPERKPSPLPLLQVSNQLGLAPKECLMIGDSCNDIQAGQRAGIVSIGCLWGYGSAVELAGADDLVHTPQELLAAITARFSAGL